MIAGLLALLACQLTGELVARSLELPVPGPVLGMVILLVWFQVREPAPDAGVVRVSEGLLKHLQLLFVPAGVGVVQYLSVIGASAVPIVLGLFVSWFLALAVTAGTAAGLLALGHRRAARRTAGSGGAG